MGNSNNINSKTSNPQRPLIRALWSFRSFSYQLEISKRGNPQNKNKVWWFFSLSSSFGSAPPPGIKHNEDLSSKTFDDAFSLWTRNKYKQGEAFKPVSACSTSSMPLWQLTHSKPGPQIAHGEVTWRPAAAVVTEASTILVSACLCLLSQNTLKRDNKSCSRYFSPWMIFHIYSLK